MIDLGGTIVVLTRDDPAIAAVVRDRVGTDDATANAVVPMIVIRHEETTRSPGGRQANARIEKQRGTYSALCYGTTRVQAEQLARLVAESWHERGIRDGTNGVRIRQSWADTIVGAENARAGLKKPFATVYIDVLAEAQPMA